MGRDIAVVIATRSGVHSPGIECQWGRDFPHPSRSSPRPTHPPAQGVPKAFPGVKRSGRGADYSLPSSAKGKERVELYLCFSSGSSCPVL